MITKFVNFTETINTSASICINFIYKEVNIERVYCPVHLKTRYHRIREDCFRFFFLSGRFIANLPTLFHLFYTQRTHLNQNHLSKILVPYHYN